MRRDFGHSNTGWWAEGGPALLQPPTLPTSLKAKYCFSTSATHDCTLNPCKQRVCGTSCCPTTPQAILGVGGQRQGLPHLDWRTGGDGHNGQFEASTQRLHQPSLPSGSWSSSLPPLVLYRFSLVFPPQPPLWRPGLGVISPSVFGISTSISRYRTVLFLED